MRRRLLLVWLLSLTVADVARSEFLTGNDLLELCQVSRSQCDAYISAYATGAHDGTEAAITLMTGESADQTLCMPSRVTASQLGDVVLGHLKQKPEERHYSAGLLTILAIWTAFPCAD